MNENLHVGDRVTLRNRETGETVEDVISYVGEYEEGAFDAAGNRHIHQGSTWYLVSDTLMPKPEAGDRVRLVHENGDTAEVTVTSAGVDYVDSTSNIFYLNSWSIEEILPPAEPQGLGAVVEHYDKDVERTLHSVRLHFGLWTDEDPDNEGGYNWSALVAVAKPGSIKVLSQGYDPSHPAD